MEKHEPGTVELGRRIVERRTELKLSRYAVAKRADISPAYLGRIEEGRGQRPGVRWIEKVARALNLTPQYLLDGSVEESPSADLDVYLRTSQGLSPDDVQQVIRVIQALKAEDELERLKRELRQRQTVADDAQAVTEEEQEDIAAYDRPDLAAEMRRQALGWTEEDGTDAEPD